jgi:hypothetical protein
VRQRCRAGAVARPGCAACRAAPLHPRPLSLWWVLGAAAVAVLPGNTDAAFTLLGPRARSQAGGAAGFTGFYARMQSVTVQNPRLTGNNTVDGLVRFVQKDGSTSNEPYRFVMTTDGSEKMIMDSFRRV